MAKNWIDAVSEQTLNEALDHVVREQRKFGLYSGTRLENCERCEFVKQDSSYPEGSPTGLICAKKRIAVAANAQCNEFSR